MSRDTSRLASVLGELADLGRRISDRATELAGLVGDGADAVPAPLAEHVADVTTSAAQLAAAAATAAASAPARTTNTRRKRPRTPATTAAVRRTRPTAGRRRLRTLMPAVVSGVVNVAAMLALAVIFVAADATPKPAAITLGATDESFVDELTPVEIEPSADEADEGEDQAAPLPELIEVADDPAMIEDVSLAEATLPVDVAPVMPVSFDAVAGPAAEAAAEGESSVSDRRGRGTGGGAPGATTFFGRAGQGQTACFICDNSNSYRDGGFHAVLEEVARAVESLRPDQSFFVVFFSDTAYPMFHPDAVDALQSASPENKRRLRSWLATVEMCGGGRGIDEAVRIAGGLGADVVYFLSDGEHAESVVDRVAAADFGGATVHTFGMQQGVLDRQTGRIDPVRVQRQQRANRNLVAIATAHGGTFTPVIVPPQAAAFERLRPIRKNRNPGPVWGLRL